jgi:hypothetical protein
MRWRTRAFTRGFIIIIRLFRVLNLGRKVSQRGFREFYELQSR